MKTIWIILLVMILFNGFLVTFSAFFPQATDNEPTDIKNDPNISPFKTPGQMNLGNIGLAIAGGASIIPVIVGGVIAFATKNLQYLAAGGIISLISLLWTITSKVIGNLFYSYPVLLSIYSLVSIAIGLMVAILILGIFTGQDQTTW